MRNRSLLTALIALCALLGPLVAGATPTAADEPPGPHHVTDWMTYYPDQTKADPITVAIYGPGSFDANVLHNLLTSQGWTDEAFAPTRYFTYSGDGVGVTKQDFTVTNNPDGGATRVRAAV